MAPAPWGNNNTSTQSSMIDDDNWPSLGKKFTDANWPNLLKNRGSTQPPNLDDDSLPTLSKTTKADFQDLSSISRDQLLAARAIAWILNRSEPLDPRRLKSQKAAAPVASPAVSPVLRHAPPPGLELPGAGVAPSCNTLAPPPGLEAELKGRPRAFTEPIPETKPVVEESEPENFKVLVSNLPDAMLQECMIRTMLEQAQLCDVEELAFRKGGKCLVTFSTYASAYKCISHVHGRKWGNSPLPVNARYVRLVRRSADTEAPQKISDIADNFAPGPTMSADAPVFVPCSAKTLSVIAPIFNADAPIFRFAEKALTRDRFMSDASTEVGDCVAEVGVV